MRALSRLVLSAFASALALGATATDAHAAWSKSYLIEWFEPAMYFGDPKVGRDKPNVDCPNGPNPANDWQALLTKPYRPVEKVKEILDPEYPNRQAMYAQFPLRGPNGENVYIHPELVKDPGLVEVSGQYAYGFDLDGNEKTGFLSPDGKTRGVDNAFYKASGCMMQFRGPPRAGASTYSNDGMHDGVFSVVVVLSGAGEDPMNDANAQIGIYLAKDKMVKDANGGIAADYTFRIDPDRKFQTVLKARVVNGVVETTDRQTISMRDYTTPGFFPKELVLEKAKARFEMRPDGSLYGHLGGYRDWREHYRGTSGNGSWGSGAIHENLGHFQLPAWWYALKRNADGLPDPVTGENRGISTAYALTGIPAHVVTPDAKVEVQVAQIFE
jgi:hypothetical protein